MDASKNSGISFIHEPCAGLVSVIIPAYNREKTILRAVDSVLKQTYTSLEVIVVDDCSDDKTVQLLNTLTDSRLRVLSLEQNGGACRARNLGVSHARGEWIAFQDSDDSWHTDKLAKQISFMQSGGYDFSFCQGYLYLMDGRRIKSPKDSYNTAADQDWYHVFMTDFPVSTQKFLCKRKVLESVGFDEALQKSQDKDFALQVAHDFKVGYLAEPLVDIYAMQDSITYASNHRGKYESVLRIVSKHRDEIQNCKAAQQFFYANLGDYSYRIDKKQSLSWYRKSLRSGFSPKVLVKYFLTVFGLRKYF